MLKKLTMLAVLLVPLCAHAQSELARYQKKIKASSPVNDVAESEKYVKIALEKNFDVTTYSPSSGTSEKKNFFNLSDKGQQAYIDALTSKTDDAKSLLEKLPTTLELSAASPEGFEVKKTEFVKRIALDVKDMNNPTQKGRIASLSIFLSLHGGDEIELTGFNNLSTKYQTIDFGTLSLTKVKSFTLNAGLEFSGTGATTTVQEASEDKAKTTGTLGATTGNTSNLGASYTWGRTLAEQIAIKNSTIIMRGSLGTSSAYILQNGVPNKNLDDRIDFELVFKSKSAKSEAALKFSGLSDYKAGDPQDAQISIRKFFYTLPQVQQEHSATIRYSYVYREIVSGYNTAMEGDDKIIYHNLEDPKNSTEIQLPFVKPADLRPEFFEVIFNNGSGQPDEDLYLNYYGTHIKLYFDSYAQAEELVVWLRNNPKATIKNFAFEKRKQITRTEYEPVAFSKNVSFKHQLKKNNN